MKRRLSQLAAVAVAVMTIILVANSPAGAVAKGLPATTGFYPFAVKFTMTNIPKPDGSHYNSGCSGALIAPQWVITAGHCFHDVNRNPVSGPPQYQTMATLGTVNVNRQTGETRTVVDVQQSPVSDVALVKLSAPVTDITPLVVSQSAPITGEALELAGWGAISSTNPAPSTQLNWGVVSVSSVAKYTTDVHGLAPFADTSACLYDSGAPYFQPIGLTTGVLLSVENNGPDCPHSSPETTARVDVLADWIRQKVR